MRCFVVPLVCGLVKGGRASLALLALALSACGDSTGPVGTGPILIQALAGDRQTGIARQELRDSVVVQVIGADGKGMAGAVVGFSVASGGGSVSPTEATSDANGIARTRWTLGPQAGTQSLRAEVRNSRVPPLELTATARAALEPAERFTRVAGDGQTFVSGCAAPVPLEVRFRAADGSPLAGAPVTFTVESGGGSISPSVATTDAQGVARASWTLGSGANAAAAAVADPSFPKLSFTAQGVPVAPKGYATIGNQIVSSVTCKPHRFVGVARSALEWVSWEWRLSVPALAAEDMRLIRSWKANVVRIPISQVFWMRTARHYDPGYADQVERLVRQARAEGLDVILDLHTSDRGDPGYAGKIEIQQMPDVNHSVPFWREVATRFKNDGGVIFELFNEPNGISWDVWLNGGTIPGGAQYDGDPNAALKAPYQAVGMQQLYEVVRSVGAHNLVLIGGTHWGYYLDKVPANRVKGYNIVYATHPYDYPDKQPELWDRDWGGLIQTDPVIISEFGVRSCNREYMQAVMDYADRHKLSWVAWAWWTPPADEPDREVVICRFPSLIRDWNGTPSVLGELVKARLASY